MFSKPIFLIGTALLLILSNASAQKQKIRITSILDEPYLMKGDDGDGDKLVGFCEDLAEKISEILDVEHEIHVVKDGRYGAQTNSTSRGGWNGMIGELINKEADMAIAPLTITEARAKVVDFSTPFQGFQLSILLQEPPEEEDESDATYTFLLPFHSFVWIAVGASILGLVIVSLIFEWSFKNPETHGEGFLNFLRQDSIYRPESLTGKVVRFVFSVFIIIVIGAYTASLAAQRIADSDEHAAHEIDSVEELVKQGDEMTYGIIDNGSTEAYFQKSDNPIYKTMLEVMNNKDTLVANYAEGLEKVREGNFAFLIESPYAEYFTSKEPCDLISVEEEFGPAKGYGIATAKGSPYSDRVNLAILELKENGELEELVDKWWNEGTCGDDDDDDSDDGDTDEDDFDQLNLSEMAGLFYFLIAGLLVSVVVWILERRATSKSTSQ